MDSNDWYITASHPMNKDHYISFVAFATGDRVQVIKQYPEWDTQVRIPKRGHGLLIWYCTRHGLSYEVPVGSQYSPSALVPESGLEGHIDTPTGKN
jgi:hypothetical protein